MAGEEAPFLLDTTMAVVRRREGDEDLLTLISPVKCDEATLAQIKARPSIQHLFTVETGYKVARYKL